MFEKYDAYKDSGVEWIGEIPSHWDVKNLRYAFDFLNHRRIPLSALERENKQGSYPYYGASGIIDYVDDYLFDEKLLLIAEDGANLLSKSTPLAFLAEGKYWVNNHAHILKPKTKAYGFWEKLLCNVDYTVFITGAAQPKLSRENLGGIRLPIPPIDEQLKIEKFIDQKAFEIDQAIAIKEQQIALLNERKQIVIQKAVTQGLEPNVAMKDSGVEWIGQIPAHWEIIKVKNLFKLIIEPAPKNNDLELLSVYTDIGVKPRKELEERGNKASTTDGYWKVRKGDIIVNKLLAWMGAIGLSNYDGVTSPAYDILRAIKPLNPYIYHLLFRSLTCSAELKKHSRGIMDMRLRLYFDKFGNVLVPYAPISEQNEIIKYIEVEEQKINAGIELINQQIEKLKEYKTTLINDAVTGKIKVA